jgi:hypothetical protein
MRTMSFQSPDTRVATAPTKGLLSLGLTALVALVSCQNEPFDPGNKLDSVRILAAKADKPYAKPGDRVNVEMLVVDERALKPRPVNVAWIPFPCINPPRDLFYLCFGGVDPSDPNQGRGSGGQAPPVQGAGSPGTFTSFSQVPPGTDLTPLIPPGPRASFVIPENSVLPRGPGQSPYGLMVLFHMACAGRIVTREIDPSQGPQGTPLGCVDEKGTQLPPSEWVIGITRVFVYDNLENRNPEIIGLNVRRRSPGQADQIAPLDLKQGLTVRRCTKDRETQCQMDTDQVRIEVVSAPSSQENNPIDKDENGEPLREQVWSTFFTTVGRFANDATLLYDSKVGKVDDSSIRFLSPIVAQTGTIHVVVRDNRGGVTWLNIPVTVTD